MARVRVLAVSQVLLVVLSVVAIGVGPVAGTPTGDAAAASVSTAPADVGPENDIDQAGVTGDRIQQINRRSDSDPPVGYSDAGDGENAVEVDPALRSSDNVQTVVVRLTEPDVPASASSEDALSLMKEHARRTQQATLSFADGKSAVSVEQTFWLTNAVVLEIKTDLVPLERLTELKHVRAIHDNFAVEALSTRTSTSASSVQASAGESNNTTYGLDQIDAPEVWKQYDTRGGGAKLAVLDTGVDPDHQDIEISEENWAEFDANGDQVSSTPHDPNGHGTHVSGTATGGNASGTAIGVASNATLMHGKVLTEDGSGTFAQIIAGMQWAVQNDADVMSMSLGAGGYHDEMIDPVRNAESAGVVVIAAIGNAGPGSTGSPGNVYETVAVGATDQNRDIADFSGGDNISKSSWDDPPADWPEYYIKPDVVAPGVDVLSATPGEDEYAKFDGTSMATPHISGTVALMLSAAEQEAGNNPSPSMVKEALAQTAVDTGHTVTRQGDGLVNAINATEYLVQEDNVSVRLDEDFPRHRVAEENATATFRVSNVEYVTVNLTSSSDANASNVSVWINGQEAMIGENVSVSEGSTNDFTITVRTSEEYVDYFDLRITFENPKATSPTATTVYPPFIQSMRVHPDPLPAGPNASRFNGSDPVTNATEYAAAGTTVAIEEGTYENGLTATDVEPGITVTAAEGADVTLKEDGRTVALLAGENMTLSGVRLEDNRTSSSTSTSFHEDIGVVITGDGATVENVEVRNVTSGALVLGTQGVTIRNTSVVTNAEDSAIELGVLVEGSNDTTVANTTVESEVFGLELYSVENFTLRNSDLTATGESGHGLGVFQSSNSTLTTSEIEGTEGPAVMVVASDAVVVSHNEIRGSNVSAGFTGSIVSALNGLGYGSFATSDGSSNTSVLSETELVEQETFSVRGEELTVVRLSPQSENELRAAAVNASSKVLELRSEIFPEGVVSNASASELESMSDEELASAIEDDAKAIKDGPDAQLHQIEFEDIVEETGLDPVVYRNNHIQGEAAGVLSELELARYENNTITNVSYPHYGVYNVFSFVKLEQNRIDHAPRTGLATETGLVSVMGITWMEGNYINATTGVAQPSVSILSVTFSEDNEIHAEDAFVNKGLETMMFLRGSDEVHAEYGVRSGALAFTFATYTDFTDTETAIYGESQYGYGPLPIYAPLNYYGSERGPVVGEDIVLSDKPTIFEEFRYDIQSAVYYDPFLTAPVDEVKPDLEKTQQFATEVVMEPGEKYAFGVPGPVEGNLSTMFSDFDGAVYVFDSSSQEWRLADGDEELAALEAVVVVPKSEARVVVEFQDYSGPSAPPTKDLSKGWNFLGSPQYGPAEQAYASSADPARIAKFFEEPQRQSRRGDDFGAYTFGADRHGPDVSGLSGYFVYVEEDGSVAGNMPRGASVADYFELVGAEISGVTLGSDADEKDGTRSSSDDSSAGQESIGADGIAPVVQPSAP